MTVSTSPDLRDGAQKSTGRPLDVIPEGGAFLSVSPGTETVGYTRNGQLSLGADVRDGRRPPGPRCPGAAHSRPARRAGDALVSGRGASVKGTQLAQLGTFKPGLTADCCLSPSVIGVARRVEPPFRLPAMCVPVELSNVTPIESMVQMIGAQRQYDASMQAIQIYKTMGSRAGQLGTLQE